MSYTQAEFDNLQDAIAKGAKRVRMSNGNEIEYHSVSDMLRLLEEMRQDLGIADPTSGRITINPNTGVE